MLVRTCLGLACLFVAAAAAAGDPPPRESPVARAGMKPPDASVARAGMPPPDQPLAPTAPLAGPPWGPLELLGESIAPGEARGLQLRSYDSFTAALVAMRGVGPGPTLCVTAAVHGDELNGVAIARQLIEEMDPTQLLGSLVIAPIVNTHGFRNGSRYLPDRRDLNRYFPGNPHGSAASRIAHRFFDQVVRHCDALVDLHTGSLNRTNVSQVRADFREPRNLRLAWGFGTEEVVHSVGREGTLRRAAGEAGIPAVIYEAGEPLRFQPKEIERGVRGIRILLESLGMVPGVPPPSLVQRHYHKTHWVRAGAAGIYVPSVQLGAEVAPGTPLAEITDPFSSKRSQVLSPSRGRIIGMALGQVVIPGFALFHIGELDAPVPSAYDEDAEPSSPEEDESERSEFVGERPE